MQIKQNKLAVVFYNCRFILLIILFSFINLPAQTTLLVDFGSGEPGNTYGLSGWNVLIKSPNVNYSSAGAGGLLPNAGGGEFDDYQGVEGTPRSFTPGERIVVTWFNTSTTETYSMTARISFEDPNAPNEDGTDGSWYTMRSFNNYHYTYQEIAPGGTCQTVFNITDSGVHTTAGNHSLVNVNLSIEWFDSNPKQYILCDKIELYDNADIISPNAPTGLNASALSDSKIELNWTAPDDNVGVVEYLVYLGANVEGYTRTTNYTAALLEPSTEYSFTVTALDKAGNESGHSNTASAVTSAFAGNAGLFNPRGLEYKGAFTLPESFAYGGDALAYNPNGDGGQSGGGSTDGYAGSLYISDLNVPDQGFCAEVTIPAPLISVSHNIDDLNQVSIIQSAFNIRPDNVNAWGDYVDIWRSDFEYVPEENQLYSSWSIYYTVTDIKHSSISFCDPDDLSGSTKYGAWYVGAQDELPNDKMLGDYLFQVPQSWADANTSGRALINGRYREGGLSGLGPTLYSIALMGIVTPPPPDAVLPFTTLLQYGSVAGSDDYNFPNSIDDYNHSDLWRDADWISGGETNAVMIIGDKAHGDNWYGYQGEHMRHTWVICDLPYPEFPETDPNGKGWQAHDYIPMAIFYNPDDLAAVANGAISSFEPQPYAAKRFDEDIFWRNGKLMEIASAVFDNVNERLFVTEFNGLNDGRLLVHVFEYNENLVTAVELLNFSASAENDRVILNWNTVTEINNSGFEIQRSKTKSKNEENWQTIGFVKGSGNSNSYKKYFYTDEFPPSGIIYYRLKQVDTNGSFKYSNTVEVNINLPDKFVLYQNYPNPFNPSTTIKYSVPKIINNQSSIINLKIYDVLGNEVAVLVNEAQSPGNYEVTFNSQKTANHKELSSGVYFYKLSAGSFSSFKKLLLLK